MKKYIEPLIIEETILLVDIIATSVGGQYSDDIEWGGSIIKESDILFKD